jgi:hypothetical protein
MSVAHPRVAASAHARSTPRAGREARSVQGMGHLIYGSSEHAIDDRTLAHVRAVIGTRLRRGEGFLLSWPRTGPGRPVALWLSQSTPLQLRFSGAREPRLDPAWLDAMLEMAGSAGGLVLVDQDVAIARSARGQ